MPLMMSDMPASHTEYAQGPAKHTDEICRGYRFGPIEWQKNRIKRVLSYQERDLKCHALREGLICGIGCGPIMDVIVNVDMPFLSKYGLEPNDAVMMSDDQQEAFKNELNTRGRPFLVSGGSTTNAIKVAQWMLNKPGCTSLYGALGTDNWGQRLRNVIGACGVHGVFEMHDRPTGYRAVLLTWGGRCRVCYLGAASAMCGQELVDGGRGPFSKAFYWYMCGGSLLSTRELFEKVKSAKQQHPEKKLVFNVSTMSCIPLITLEDLGWIDVLFGNAEELTGLAKHLFPTRTTDKGGAIFLLSHARKAQKPDDRLVVLTDGDGPVLATSGLILDEYPLPMDCILSPTVDRDMVGGGDAFVGGFLSQLARGSTISECVQGGFYAANVILGQVGTSLPATPPDRWWYDRDFSHPVSLIEPETHTAGGFEIAPQYRSPRSP